MGGATGEGFGHISVDALFYFSAALCFGISAGLTLFDIKMAGKIEGRERKRVLISVWKHPLSLLLASACGALGVGIFCWAVSSPKSNLLQAITLNQAELPAKALAVGVFTVAILRSRLSDFSRRLSVGADKIYTEIRNAVIEDRINWSTNTIEKFRNDYLIRTKGNVESLVILGRYARSCVETSSLSEKAAHLKRIDADVRRIVKKRVRNETEDTATRLYLLDTALKATGSFWNVKRHVKHQIKNLRSVEASPSGASQPQNDLGAENGPGN